MEDLLACRVCLATDVNLYDIYKYKLKNLYETVAGIYVSPADNYPQYLCSFCSALLLKCASFREKCKKTQQLMKYAEMKSPILTTSQIANIANKNKTRLPYSISTPEITSILPLTFDQPVQYISVLEDVADQSDEEPLSNKVTKTKQFNIEVEVEPYESDEPIPCYEPIACSEEIARGKQISCEEPIACYELIACEEPIVCGKVIACGEPNTCDETVNVCEQPVIVCDGTVASDQPIVFSHPIVPEEPARPACDESIPIDDDDSEDESINLTDLDAGSISGIDYDSNIFETENENDGDNDSELPSNEIKVIVLTKEEQIQEIEARKDSYNYNHSVYKCDLCFKGFIQDVTFKNHMLRHDPLNGPEICEICKTRWPDIRSLRSHTSTAHGKKYLCRICDQVSSSSYRAKEHLKWHKGHKFVCNVCGATFSKSTSHLTHLRMQHPSKYCCDVCGESFLGETGLNMHKKKSHRGFETADKVPQIRCGVCLIKFKSVDALKRHINGYEDGVCDDSRSSCFQCGENLLTQELLKQHQKTHEAGVRCEECNKDFAHERSFSVHYQRVHMGHDLKHYKPSKERGGKSACVCEVCGKTCMSNATLMYHMRTHTGEKPYQCSECPKKFSIFQRLQIHYRTHSGERPFKCTHCPKAFKHKAALNRHDRVHSGAKPYQCIHCGKTFSQSNSMKLHVRTVHLKMPAPYRARRNNRNELCDSNKNS